MIRPIPFDEFPLDDEVPGPQIGTGLKPRDMICFECPLPDCEPEVGECPLMAGGGTENKSVLSHNTISIDCN